MVAPGALGVTRRRTAFVTGASSGFGADITRRFALDGYQVVACGRRLDKLAELARSIGSNVLPIELDVRDRGAVEDAVGALPAEFDEVDVLVNNAGLAKGMEPAQEARLADWEEMLDTNCKGLLYCTRALLPGMVIRSRGHVINMGSVAGTYPYPGGNAYGASKAFVHQFTLNLRSDLHGTGVRVTCIEPGMSGGTEFSTVRFDGDERRAAATYAGMEPLRSEDVAEAVYWAASQPSHVNVTRIELMPVAQSSAPFQVYRSGVG
jgi:3-hydroxy acid dehydrogenase/malonic semialdehyde reductase